MKHFKRFIYNILDDLRIMASRETTVLSFKSCNVKSDVGMCLLDFKRTSFSFLHIVLLVFRGVKSELIFNL
jgi:hypothetical protein